MRRAALFLAVLIALPIPLEAQVETRKPKRLWSFDTESSATALVADRTRVILIDSGGVREHTTVGDSRQTWNRNERICAPGSAAIRADGHLFVTDNVSTLSASCPGRLHQIDRQDEVIRTWSGLPGMVRAHAVVGDKLGAVFLAEFGHIVRLDESEEVGAEWTVPDIDPNLNPVVAMAVTPEGHVAIGLRGAPWLLIYTRDGDFVRSLESGVVFTGSVFMRDMDMDGEGNFYLLNRYGRVYVHDPDGNLFWEWSNFNNNANRIAVDEDGYVYLANFRCFKFDNKPDTTPDLNLPDHPPYLALHVSPPAASKVACGSPPGDPRTLVTASPGPEDASEFFVYVMATPTFSLEEGTFQYSVLGGEFGIYHKALVEGGLVVHGWTSCAPLEFPVQDWPASGSGTGLSWPLQPTRCQDGQSVALGYFRLSAYSEAILGFRPHPVSRRAAVIGCDNTDKAEEFDAPDGGLGWVSLRGGSVNGVDTGCNPLLGPCDEVVPVRPMTWGGVKTLFR